MSENKFTPGPWLVKGDEVGYISQEDDQSFGMFCPVAIVCVGQYANQIAAAPELLEALEAAVDCGMVPVSSAKDGGANKYSEQVRAADQIRAAIAKARGQS